MIETLYETFKAGQGVTLPRRDGFYLDRRRDDCALTFHPSQTLRALFGWSSTYKGKV